MTELKKKEQQLNTENKQEYVNDLVSIITPAYNAAEYISETIESVLEQTYPNWEMLIINDCSKDNTAEIVQSYAIKDNRIKLINLNKNGGVAAARNTAIQNARGRYIAFLDSDDLWKKEKLKKQLGFMQQNGYLFTFTAYKHFKNDKENAQNMVEIPKKLNYKQALKGNQIGCLTVMLDRNQIQNVEFSKQKHEDYILWLNILRSGIIAYGLNDSLALYRIGNSKSISNNKLKSAIWTWNVYRNNQKLSLLDSFYYMFYYVKNGLIKHG